MSFQIPRSNSKIPKFRKVNHISPPIVFSFEPRLVSIFWAYSPKSLQRVSFWCLFLPTILAIYYFKIEKSEQTYLKCWVLFTRKTLFTEGAGLYSYRMTYRMAYRFDRAHPLEDLDGLNIMLYFKSGDWNNLGVSPVHLYPSILDNWWLKLLTCYLLC